MLASLSVARFGRGYNIVAVGDCVYLMLLVQGTWDSSFGVLGELE